jgi:signal transduction histidine kinase
VTRLFRSSSFRLALGFAGLFVASSLILVGLLWWRTAGYLDREIDAVIESDERAVGDRLRDFGLVGAIKTVQDRAANGDKNAIYLLVNPAFERLGGNLSAWPAEIGYTTGWYHAQMTHDGQPRATRLLNVGLPGGFHLLLGRDVQDREQIRVLILNGLAWATAGALVLAALGGLIARRTLLGRLDVISRTTTAIVRGDLGQRVPEGGTDDEFDQLSRMINRMLEQIQTLIEGVRNVSNAVAHDLRTPLAEARSRLEDIVNRRPSEPEVFAGIGGALDDIDRLIEMSNALLRLAEIDSGVRRSGFRRIDPAEMATEIVELYQPTAEARQIRLGLVAPPDLSVNGDPFLLAQAIGNLVDNAIKYAAAGGVVTVGLRARDGDVEIVVSDNGPGIPEGEKSRVTERFYRGDSSRGQVGVGLGLSVASSIATLHDGALSFSDNHPGLVATLRLPMTG